MPTPTPYVRGEYLECIDHPMPASYWVRNKKLSINLQDNPFAVDRQLSDQRYMIEKNRNPRVSEPTKVDKVRSEQMIAKKGSSRPVAIKANVLNKIVREASNVHSYVIIPPPKVKDGNGKTNDDDNDIDPETHPRFRVYAKEANRKPTVMSFGHRPRSASRVFHPATMRIKLKHGEIAHSNNVSKDATGFGLPVAILSQVIKAPHIPKELMETATDSPKVDPYNLFGAPSSPYIEHQQHRDNDSITEATWVSNIDNESSLSRSLTLRNKGKKKNKKLEPLHDQPWNEGFHNIIKSNKELVTEKTVGRKKEPLTLLERMHRYESMSVEDGTSLFCVEKQINDIEQIKGNTIMPKKPEKGSPVYYDPRNSSLQTIKDNRVQLEAETDEKRRSKLYQDALSTVPLVAYNPINELKNMNKKSGGFVSEVFTNDIDWSNECHWPKNDDVFLSVIENAKQGDRVPLVVYIMNSSKRYDINTNWPTTEEFQSAYSRAKKGDRQALFRNFMMKDYDGGVLQYAQNAADSIIEVLGIQ